MDPLSVTASVVGLLAAAGQVVSILYHIKLSMSDAPRSIDQLLSQINEIEVSLTAVNKLFVGINAAPRRRVSMIQVDQLVATLSEAVLTFSELEALVTPFGGGSKVSMLERLKWTWKEDTVASIMLRLDRHKSSLALMLTIVQCESDLVAEQSLGLLQDLVQQLLESNQDISRRLRSIDTYDESILTTSFTNVRSVDTSEVTVHESKILSAQYIPVERERDPDLSDDIGFQYSYEIDLKTSRVYKRTQPYPSDISFTTSIADRTHAWSVFSGLSLSQVSLISAIALPVYSKDLFNPQWFDFDLAGQRSSSRTAKSRRFSTASSQTWRTLNRKPYAESLSGSTASFSQFSSKSLSSSPPTSVYSEASPIRSQHSPISRSKSDRRVPLYKLVVLGDYNSGRDQLVRQFMRNNFIRGYVGGLLGSFRKQAVIDGYSCMVEVLNDNGQDEHEELLERWIRDAEGFVLVYSIGERSSFDIIARLDAEIRRIKGPKPSKIFDGELPPRTCPIMLVGNFVDGPDRVGSLEGQGLARRLGCRFVETSLKDPDNIEKAFYDVVRSIRKREAYITEVT